MSDNEQSTKEAAMKFALDCAQKPELLSAVLGGVRQIVAASEAQRILTDDVYWKQFRDSLKAAVYIQDKQAVFAVLTELEDLRGKL